VVLRLPCELVINHLLPVLRVSLAKELVHNMGMSQVEAARALGITQPAVYNYLRSPVKTNRELSRHFEEVKTVAEELAKDISKGDLTQQEALRRVCHLCLELRTDGPICRLHEVAAPELARGSCSLCLQDLVVERRRSLEEYEVLENVRLAVRLIEGSPAFPALVPEIGTNVVMAKAGAKSLSDVVGVQGRIHVAAGKARATGPPAFGGSSHIASAVLTAMKHDPSTRAALNIRYDTRVIKICEEMGLLISSFSRREEPPEVKRVDGKTIPWGIRRAIEKVGRLPDVVYDLGDIGKEAMVFLFRATAFDAAYLANRIAEEYHRRTSRNRKQSSQTVLSHGIRPKKLGSE
jgi:predicted fused transcriptional regulator/phosphomethylpyrimidine kinase/predicted transcriptional regulator